MAQSLLLPLLLSLSLSVWWMAGKGAWRCKCFSVSTMKYREERLRAAKEICTALYCYCDVPVLTGLYWLFPVYVKDRQYFEKGFLLTECNLKACSHCQFYCHRAESGRVLALWWSHLLPVVSKLSSHKNCKKLQNKKKTWDSCLWLHMRINWSNTFWAEATTFIEQFISCNEHVNLVQQAVFEILGFPHLFREDLVFE